MDLLTEKLAQRGVNVIRIGNPSRVSDLLLQHTLDAGVMAHPSYSKMHAMRQTAAQYRETANAFATHLGAEERLHRQWLRDEARSLRQAANDLERFITEDVLESVQVITCTLVGANPEEANLLMQRLIELLGSYDPNEKSDTPLTIGVIAPYRAQINNLQDAIEDNAALNDLFVQRMLSVGTVDSFQGQERDIIAISLTRSNPRAEIGFLSDIRRMNVGMTRARRKLLIVGDSSTFCCHPFFRDLLIYVKRVGGYVSASVSH